MSNAEIQDNRVYITKNIEDRVDFFARFSIQFDEERSNNIITYPFKELRNISFDDYSFLEDEYGGIIEPLKSVLLSHPYVALK